MVFLVSIINIFFIRSPLINSLIAIAVGIAYAIYLLVDTQLILGGKHKSLSMDNYILGAIILYIDIIGLFLKILQILGKKKDD
jgi:FtsH-binding integral membrane protein